MRFSIINLNQIDKLLLRLEAEFYNSNSSLSTNFLFGKEVIDKARWEISNCSE